MSTPISLGTTVNYTVKAAVVKSLTEVTVQRWVDRPLDKVVIAWVNEIPGPITLWSGADYDAIGNWTEAQAEAKLKAILTK